MIETPTDRLTIKQIQDEHREWLVRNFGEGNDPADLEQFLGVVEEIGELAESVEAGGRQSDFKPLVEAARAAGKLAHALLKSRQGIRGSQEKHEAAARDAVGDIFIFLSGFCCRKGWDLGEIIHETWAEVKTRDWTKKASGVDR